MKKDDLIELGSYRGKPLRWRVLSADRKSCLLIAEKILDAMPYAGEDSGYRAVFWSRSPVRERLGRLYEECFTAKEKKRILPSFFSLQARSADGAVETLDEAEDGLFLPSELIMEKYFAEDAVWHTKRGFERDVKNLDRLCEVDDAALEHGLEADEPELDYRPRSSSAFCAYWLSTPTHRLDDWQLCVDSSGLIRARNNKEILGIRPMMRLRPGKYPSAGTFRYEEKPVAETPHVFRTVTMGRWEGYPLRWLVLKEEEDRMLVISEKGVAPMPFHEEHWSVRSYPRCNTRRWLTEEFYEGAFSEEEKGRILTTTVRTPLNPSDVSGWKGPDDVEDPVFLLLYDEVKETFPSQIDLFCYPLQGGEEPVGWWLRDHCTLADSQDAIAEGWTDDYYCRTYLPQGWKGVYARPAMWIRKQQGR